ncbi:DsbA family oxidoreductase [Comamonadaceae bacterium M7527]|nr:DsbA family oxidoreductase [Comamonadaceae bacterium M7527]
MTMTTAQAVTSPLHIDIVSDVMCPWCVIGYMQLARALETLGTPHTIRWHPFELNPNMPPEGQNITEHIAQKYGATPEQSQASRVHMTQAGAAVGFEFAYTDDMRMHNTFNTHQLLHWAAQLGRMHDLKMALFTAHFTHGRNLSDDAILADIAASIGLDPTQAAAVLADQRFAAEVRAAQQFWVQQGIQSVPAVVFNKRHLVSGAQGVDNFTQILHQLNSMSDQPDAA